MQHFFVEPSQICGNEIRILGMDVNHIKNVLRMHTGEVISIGTGEDDREYRCEIKEISDDVILCQLMFVKLSGVELPAKITLFQGLPKADKMEFIIQKAVELGVSEIVPVATSRCVVKLDDKKAASKVTRWQAISEAAAKQSKRGIIPTVTKVMPMQEAVKYASAMQVKAIPYELAEGMDATRNFLQMISKSIEEQKQIDNQSNSVRVAIFIGPEGGFDEKEIAMAQDEQIMPISLGKRILRTETAGMTILSIVMYHLECENI